MCKGSLDVLAKLARDLKGKGDQLRVSLSFDEMAIAKNVSWNENKKKFVGFINYGTIQENQRLPVASNAIVFMVNGINVRFNQPIGFYFINTLKTSEKMLLIITALKFLAEIDVKVCVITFDGLSTNVTSMEFLGASFRLDNLRPYIISPIDNSKIFILFDPPHMLKLMRNLIGAERLLFDRHGGKIEWKFYENLEKCRVDNGLVTHKVTKKHLNWTDNKMNVGLAAQLLSNSVASSMRYLLERNDPHFEGSNATIEFTERLNHMFDVLNSREGKSRMEFKSPLSPANINMTFVYIDDCIDYLKKLRSSEGPVVNSLKKTGPKGLIIDMVSIKMLYEDLIETSQLSELPVYLLNQDPLESFFSRIRSFNCLGSNDNPTTTQFCSAYRKNLVKNEITASAFANCKDELNILTVSSSHKPEKVAANADCDEDNEQADVCTHAQKCVHMIEQTEKKCVIDSYSDVTIAFIATSIEEIVREKGLFQCSICENIFEENAKISLTSVPGKQLVPCESTFYICKVTHDAIEPFLRDLEFDYDRLINKIIETIEKNENSVYPKTNFTEHFHHRSYIVSLVAKHCIRLCAIHIARSINLQIHERNIRRKYIKEIQLRGQ